MLEEVFNFVKLDSICFSCGYKICVWENVFVISYLFFKGKCVKCKVGILVWYLLVELFIVLVCIFVVY